MAMPFALLQPAGRAAQQQAPKSDTPSGTSVYVANIPYDADEAAVRGFFDEQCAPAQVQKVKILQKPDGGPKGACVISFDTAAGAQKAMSMDGEPGLEGRKLLVKEDLRDSSKEKGKGKGRLKRGAPSAGQAAAGGGGGAEQGEVERPRKAAKHLGPEAVEAASRSVIVKNLPFNATEAHLGVLFASVGELSQVRLAKDHRSGKSKGFAVVEFMESAAVPTALKRDGRMVRGRPVRVERMIVDGEEAKKEPLSDGEAAKKEEDKEGGEAAEAADDAAPRADGSALAAAAAGGAAEAKKQPAAAQDDDDEVVDVAGRNIAEDPSPLATGSAGIGTRPAGIGTLPAAGTTAPASSSGLAGGSLQSHAAQLKQRAASALQQGGDDGQPQQKRAKGCGTSTDTAEAAKSFPPGEAGLLAGAALATEHGSAEALLTALGAEELKQRLVAIGLKSGGSPTDRAERFLRLRGANCVADLPQDMFPPIKSKGKKDIAVRKEPIKFVKAASEPTPEVAD